MEQFKELAVVKKLHSGLHLFVGSSLIVAKSLVDPIRDFPNLKSGEPRVTWRLVYRMEEGGSVDMGGMTAHNPTVDIVIVTVRLVFGWDSAPSHFECWPGSDKDSDRISNQTQVQLVPLEEKLLVKAIEQIVLKLAQPTDKDKSRRKGWFSS